jgi:hypothetical protein
MDAVYNMAMRPLESLAQRSHPSIPGLYTQLPSNTIRLLRIFQTTKLQGELLIVHLGDCPDYAALSYHWGEQQGGYIEFPENRTLSLSRNLELALQSLTYESQVELPLLWIDQICINQHDLDERDNQIRIMSEIYLEAAEVMVWLGSEFEVNNIPQLSWAAECLLKDSEKNPTMAQIQELLVKEARNAIISDIEGLIHDRSSQALLLAEQGFFGLLSLWNRPWFERLWVRQEVALAEQVTFLCGNHRFALKKLATACDKQWRAAHAVLSIRAEGEWSKLGKEAAISCLQVSRAQELFELIESTASSRVYERQDLLDVLRYAVDLKATQGHDRVYAIYRLSSAALHRKFWPDYEKQVEQLWRELAAYLLMDFKTWNNFRSAADKSRRSSDESLRSSNGPLRSACPAVVLALRSTQEDADRHVPLSWVPQFDRLGHHTWYKFDHYVLHSHKFAAGGKGDFKPIVNLNGQATLKVRGVVYSEVASVNKATQQPSLGGSIPHEFETDDYWSFIRNELVPWYLRCHQYAGKPQSYDFARLLCQGVWAIEGEKGSATGGPDLAEFLRKVEDVFSTDCKYLNAKGMYHDLLPFIARDAWRVDNRDNRRILAILSNKRKGWVPDSTRVGDSVLLMEGAPFPFVVRKCSERALHNIVGDAYFDGVQREGHWKKSQSQIRDFEII